MLFRSVSQSRYYVPTPSVDINIFLASPEVSKLIAAPPLIPTFTKTITQSSTPSQSPTVTTTKSITPTITTSPTPITCTPLIYNFNHEVRVITGTRTLRLRAEPNSSSIIIGQLFDTADQASLRVPLYIEKVVKLCNGDIWAIYGGYFALRISNYYGYTDVNPK